MPMRARTGRSLASLVAAITPSEPHEVLDAEWDHEWFDWSLLDQAVRDHDAGIAFRQTMVQ